MLENKLRKPTQNLSKAIADMDSYARKYGKRSGGYLDRKARVRKAEVEILTIVTAWYLGVDK